MPKSPDAPDAMDRAATVKFCCRVCKVTIIVYTTSRFLARICLFLDHGAMRELRDGAMLSRLHCRFCALG